MEAKIFVVKDSNMQDLFARMSGTFFFIRREVDFLVKFTKKTFEEYAIKNELVNNENVIESVV